MEKLIDSIAVGVVLCLSLFVPQEEENAQRHYKFPASSALRDKLDRINWNEL